MMTDRSTLTLKICFWTSLLFFGGYLGWMTLRLEVNPFDTYELYINSRLVAGINDQGGYVWRRAPFYPILMSLFFFLEHHLFQPDFGERACRILAVFISLGLVVTTYRILRFHLARKAAFLGAFLFTLNPLFIHHTPFNKEDLPGTLWVALAFLFYLKDLKKHRIADRIWSSFFITAAVTTRYNLLAGSLAVIFFHQIFSGIVWRDLRREGWKSFVKGEVGQKVFFYFVVPVFCFFALPMVIYGVVGWAALLEAPAQFFRDLKLLFGMNNMQESRFQNYAFLWLAYTGPLIFFSIVGMVLSIKEKAPEALFYALWFWAFFLFQTYGFGHQEARYLFPAFPPLYFFVSRGFFEISGKGRIPALAALLVLALPVKKAAAEYLKFQDPVYTTPFERKISREAKALAGDSEVFWVGNFYPIHPKDYVFHPEDEVGYIYHFFKHVVRFYNGEAVRGAIKAEFAYPDQGRSGVFPLNVGRFVQSGDVLLINTEPHGYLTNSIPEKLRPLIVQRVRVLVLGPASSSAYAQFFRVQGLEHIRVEIAHTEEGTVVRGYGFPDGYFELYLVPNSQIGPQSFAIVKVEDGKFELFRKIKDLPDMQGVMMLTYDQMQPYFHP